MFRKRRNIQKEKSDVKTYGFTYVKEHNQVKQDYATVKTTTVTGVRTVDHGEQVLKAGKVVVATVVVMGALIYGVTVSASTFGFGVSIAIPVITSAFLYFSSTIEDDDEKNSQ